MTRPKRPRDPNQLAKLITDLTTRTTTEVNPDAGKDAKAVAVIIPFTKLWPVWDAREGGLTGGSSGDLGFHRSGWNRTMSGTEPSSALFM
jgi:hypothetical protein